MPELPEVETVMRGLSPAMNGKTIKSINVFRRDLRVTIPEQFEKMFQGRRISALKRRGKYMLVFVDGGNGFVWHLGMSGRVRTYASSAQYVTEKHDHVVFTMEDDAVVVFHDPRRFGMIYPTQEQSWKHEKPFSMMGPEPLDQEFTVSRLAKNLSRRKIAIKAALLDQSVVAGLGNIYVCEALYHAGIHPGRPSQDVSGDEMEVLVPSIQEVLRAAIKSGGSSLRDYQHTDGSLGYFQHQFTVYNREGLACASCTCKVEEGLDVGVQRIIQAGRSSYFCEYKQV